MPDTIYRLSVSFISIGAGIDRKAKPQYSKYIIEFAQKNKIKLNCEIVNWGREGEVDYCFELTELDEKQQELFLT